MWDTSGGPGAARGAAGPVSSLRPTGCPFLPGAAGPGRAWGRGSGSEPCQPPGSPGQRRYRRAGRALPCPAAGAALRGPWVLQRTERTGCGCEGNDGEGECCWRTEPSPREGCPGLLLPAATESLGFSGVFLAWFGFASLCPQLWFCAKRRAQLSQLTKNSPKLCALH